MAKYSSVFGRFSGSVGNLVFCSGNSRSPYVREKTTIKKDHIPSDEQLAVRAKFSLSAKFLRNFQTIINIAWKGSSRKKSGARGAASSYLFHYGFVGDFPDISYNYANIRLSAGKLFAGIITSCLREDNVLTITWEDPGPTYQGRYDDEAIVAVYSEHLDVGVTFRSVALREDNKAIVNLNEAFLDTEVHCWLIFLSYNEKDASNSIYLGTGKN